MSELIAEVPTSHPKRILRAYLTPSGFLWLGEYERLGRRGDLHPTTAAVLVSPAAIGPLLDALQGLRAEAGGDA